MWPFGKRQVNEEWRNTPWIGIGFWSESLTDKNVPRKFAENIVDKARSLDIPILISLGKKMMVIGVDATTHQPRMWQFSSEVLSPTDTQFNQRILSIVDSARVMAGSLGRVQRVALGPMNYDKMITDSKDCHVWYAGKWKG